MSWLCFIFYQSILFQPEEAFIKGDLVAQSL